MLLGTARHELQFAFSVFRDGLEDGGCLICRAVARVEQSSLFAFLYEGITAPDVMEKFVKGGGFCSRHFWWVMSLGTNHWGVGRFEIATVCKQLMRRALIEIQTLAKIGGQGGRFSLPRHKTRPPVFPGGGCIFCHERLDRERNLVQLLEIVVEQEEFAQVVAAHGLCLHHAHIALTSWKQVDRINWLSEIIRAQSDQLVLDLQAFLRKYDNRFRDEPFGREIDAVDRAVHFLAGPDLSRPLKPEAGRSSARLRGDEASGAK